MLFYSFNNDVRRIVDNAIENVDTSLWTTLSNKTSARDSSVATAEQLAREALEKIGMLAFKLIEKQLKIKVYFREM